MTVLRSLCLSISLSASVSLSLLILASFFLFLPCFSALRRSCDHFYGQVSLSFSSLLHCVFFFPPLLLLLLLLITSLALVLWHSTNFNIPHIDFLITPLPFATPPLSLSLSPLLCDSPLSLPSFCLSFYGGQLHARWGPLSQLLASWPWRKEDWGGNHFSWKKKESIVILILRNDARRRGRIQKKHTKIINRVSSIILVWFFFVEGGHNRPLWPISRIGEKPVINRTTDTLLIPMGTLKWWHRRWKCH